MNSKHPAIRVLGQKSIPSTFFFRSSNQNSGCKKDATIKIPNKGSRVTLSDFLNQKLHRNAVLPNSVQEKERPFLSPVGSSGISGSNQEHNGTKKRGEAEGNSVVDLVFEKFKCTRKETEDALDPCDDVEFGSSNTDMQNARKRKNPFDGEDGKQSERKHLVVLGEVQPKQTCPLPKQKGKEQSTNKKPKHQFNHYANGCGWWDCNMEGVDNEEVGCSEVWEGIGSATLGGLDWH